MSEHEKNLNEHVLFTGSSQRSDGVYCQELK